MNVKIKKLRVKSVKKIKALKAKQKNEKRELERRNCFWHNGVHYYTREFFPFEGSFNLCETYGKRVFTIGSGFYLSNPVDKLGFIDGELLKKVRKNYIMDSRFKIISSAQSTLF